MVQALTGGLAVRTLLPLLWLLSLSFAHGSTHPPAEAESVGVMSLRRAPPAGLDPKVLDHALRAVACATRGGVLNGALHPERLTVIDYSLPSTARRLWVIDVERGEVLRHELVAHGRNSGDDRAHTFGNEVGSNMSSLGLFRTGETYIGSHGRSLRLDGLDPGFNDRARERAIVIHGADYASPAFVERVGRLGRSFGCPSLDETVAQEVIGEISGGSLMFAWYPDERWLAASPWLNCAG
jgi:hypothetical protein